MRDLSPRGIQEHIAALDAFSTAYVAYLEADPHGNAQLRQRVIEAIPAADRALMAAGATFYVEDPPMMALHRRRYVGLANTAFLHEQLAFSGPALYERVLDAVKHGQSVLVDMERKARAARKRPSYWIDRALRTLLMIPAYLVSLLVGDSARQIDRSAWGFPLRIIGVVADALGVYGGGKLLGLW